MADDSQQGLRLKGVEKAAVLLLSLGEEVAADVIRRLPKKEVGQLTLCATKLPSVGESVIRQVQDEYMSALLGGDLGLGGAQSRDKMQSILSKFLSEEQVEEYMDSIMYTEDLSEGFEAIKYIDEDTIAAFIKSEHPQTAALILAHLDVQKSAEVVSLLEPELQSDIILRISNLDRVSPQMVRDIQEVFVSEMIAAGGQKSQSVGGTASVAALMNQMDSKTVAGIFDSVNVDNPEFCEEVRALMFVFADLVNLDDRGLQSVIKEVTNEILTLALRTAPDDLKDMIYRNISSRAAELIQEELEVMGPVKLSEVETAQKEIVAIARRLEDEGKIALSGSGGNDTLV